MSNDEPAFGELADEDDELDSSGVDFKDDPTPDDEVAELLEGDDA